MGAPTSRTAIEKMLKLYREGKKKKEIAAILEIDPDTVSKYIAKEIKEQAIRDSPAALFTAKQTASTEVTLTTGPEFTRRPGACGHFQEWCVNHARHGSPASLPNPTRASRELGRLALRSSHAPPRFHPLVASWTTAQPCVQATTAPQSTIGGQSGLPGVQPRQSKAFTQPAARGARTQRPQGRAVATGDCARRGGSSGRRGRRGRAPADRSQ
jgi:hypothetical protein